MFLFSSMLARTILTFSGQRYISLRAALLTVCLTEAGSALAQPQLLVIELLPGWYIHISFQFLCLVLYFNEELNLKETICTCWQKKLLCLQLLLPWAEQIECELWIAWACLSDKNVVRRPCCWTSGPGFWWRWCSNTSEMFLPLRQTLYFSGLFFLRKCNCINGCS